MASGIKQPIFSFSKQAMVGQSSIPPASGDLRKNEPVIRWCRKASCVQIAPIALIFDRPAIWRTTCYSCEDLFKGRMSKRLKHGEGEWFSNPWSKDKVNTHTFPLSSLMQEMEDPTVLKHTGSSKYNSVKIETSNRMNDWNEVNLSLLMVWWC